jgi:tetratricopeptide (TPR) repeat protein
MDRALEPDAAPRSPVVAASSARRLRIRWILLASTAVVVLAVAVSSNAWREAIGRTWAKTLPAPPLSARSAAADLYLKGRYYWNKRTPGDLNKAVDYFTQSIVADPSYAKAFVGLADCYGLLREFAAMPANEAWPRALAAARKAVELDDSLPEAHSTLGFDLFYGSLDVKGGEREFRRALELNPNYAQGHHWYATALMSIGRLGEASDQMQRARELDPSSRAIVADQGLLLFYENKVPEAIEQLREVEAAEPSFRSAHAYLAQIYFLQHDGQKYLSEARLAAESSNSPAEFARIQSEETGFRRMGWPGLLESQLAMEKSLAAQGRPSFFKLAEVSALLGRNAEALNYLKQSFDKREPDIITLPVNRPLLALQKQPEYERLVSQLGGNAAGN